jgi:hypothetical protein
MRVALIDDSGSSRVEIDNKYLTEFVREYIRVATADADGLSARRRKRG